MLGLSTTMLVLDHTFDCRGAGAYDATHWAILFFKAGQAEGQTHQVTEAEVMQMDETCVKYDKDR